MQAPRMKAQGDSVMHTTRHAFSLIELVIVIVILGIIGAIAIPRMSRGAEAAKDASLVADLNVLRSAIDLYQAEHEGSFPSAANIATQLTQFTDINGNVSAVKENEFVFGPYLRSIPKIKVGSKRGKSDIAAATGADVAWLYNATTGTITADLPGTETDSNGVAYNTY